MRPSRVTIRTSPALIEAARAAQYANRERFAARELEIKIRDKVQRQVIAKKRSQSLPDNLVGGQLEASKDQKRKIWARRRRPLRGFLLIPSANYDQQGRLPVQSDLGAQYGVTQNALGDNLSYPFNLIDNRLIIKAYPSTPGLQGQYLWSAIRHVTPMREAETIFTFEFFAFLEASAQRLPSVQDLGNNTEKLTSFFCFLSLEVTQANNFVASIRLNKYRQYSQGPGLRESWGIQTSPVGVENPDQDILVTTGGSEYHVAMVRNGTQSFVYFNGQLVHTLQSTPAIAVNSNLSSLFFAQSIHQERIVNTQTSEEISRTFFPDTPKSGFRCFRFTPGEAVYSGTSFTPPTTITDLA